MTVLAAAQGNGTTTAIGAAAPGGRDVRTLTVTGTFNGATVKFQISPDSVTFIDVPDANAITAATAVNVQFTAQQMRIDVSGGGGSESINAEIN